MRLLVKSIAVCVFMLVGNLIVTTQASAAPAAASELIWGPEPAAVGAEGQASAQASSNPSPQVWGACGNSTSNTKVVRTFTRQALTANNGGFYLRSGSSNLLCGDANSGYRHIQARHQSQFAAMAGLSGQNWRDIADVSINVALSDPDLGVYRAGNGILCFQRVLFLYKKGTGEVVGQQNVVAAVRVLSPENVITAYPGTC